MTALGFVCAWCQRVRLAGGEWRPADLEPAPRGSTHGICPECLAQETRSALGDAAAPLRDATR